MRANRTAARLFIVLPSKVDRYSETYGPTDFEDCLVAALLGPNRSSLAIERVGLTCACGAGWDGRFASSIAAAPLLESNRILESSTTPGEKTKWPHKGAILVSGGEGGIRTHGTRKRTPDFESGPFDHSGTSPVATIFH